MRSIRWLNPMKSETDAARLTRITETLAAVRIALPATENVEWNETIFKVDNSWLHRELEKLEKGTSAEQPECPDAHYRTPSGNRASTRRNRKSQND